MLSPQPHQFFRHWVIQLLYGILPWKNTLAWLLKETGHWSITAFSVTSFIMINILRPESFQNSQHCFRARRKNKLFIYFSKVVYRVINVIPTKVFVISGFCFQNHSLVISIKYTRIDLNIDWINFLTCLVITKSCSKNFFQPIFKI